MLDFWIPQYLSLVGLLKRQKNQGNEIEQEIVAFVPSVMKPPVDGLDTLENALAQICLKSNINGSDDFQFIPNVNIY